MFGLIEQYYKNFVTKCMKRILIFIVSIFITSCNVKSEKKIDKENVKFATTSDSRLYFKNVRQIYYDKENQEHTKMEIYRFGKRNLSQQVPVLNVALVHNWRYDEAYVIIEPNSYFDNVTQIEVEWQNPSNKQSGVYRFSFGSKENHYKFATEIYQSILAKHKLLVYNTSKQWVNLFASEADRDNFRKTMVDYYRLVNLYY
jgi:hypothetical protein